MPLWSIRSDEIPDPSSRLDRLILDLLQSGAGSWQGTPPSAFSRSQVQSWIEKGLVKVDGAVVTKSSALKTRFERLDVELPDAAPLQLVPEDRALEVLYEDSDLVVVNKPPGLTVHPSETQKTGTLVHALLHHVKDLSGIGGTLRPGIVHRIDKDTSGALVITKNDRAHLAMTEIFSRHEIERKYWALCYGAPAWTERHRLETKIGRHPKDRKKMTTEVKEGRKAVSHFRCLERFGESGKKPFASWIEAELETGRTHQVRVHLTSLHHSILGDPVYGTPTSQQAKWRALPREVQEAVENLQGQALHARVLGFKHPVTGESLRFEAAPPAEFQRLLDTLERYR